MKVICAFIFLLNVQFDIANIVVSNRCDYNKNDLYNFHTANAEECGSKCVATARCTHFTWIPTSWWGTPRCFLKYADVLDDVLKSYENESRYEEARCGYLEQRFSTEPVPKIEFNEDCDYMGNDMFNDRQITTVQGCAAKCYDVPECTHFTWDVVTWTGEPICYLKHAPTKEQALTSLVNSTEHNLCGYIPEGRFGVVTWTSTAPPRDSVNTEECLRETLTMTIPPPIEVMPITETQQLDNVE